MEPANGWAAAAVVLLLAPACTTLAAGGYSVLVLGSFKWGLGAR